MSVDEVSAQQQVDSLAAAGMAFRGEAATLMIGTTPEGGTPRSIEGPYYVPMAGTGLERSNIAEDDPGIPLSLGLTVLGASDRTPILGAVVDVWHCDSAGFYSAHRGTDPDQMPPLKVAVPPEEDDDSRDLRGTQTTDADGHAHFQTVYPGWYWGRAIHIHVKVWIGGTEVYTGQLYLPEETNALIETLPPYDRHTAIERVPNAMDGVYQGTDGEAVILAVEPRSDDIEGDGFIGSYTFLVADQ